MKQLPIATSREVRSWLRHTIYANKRDLTVALILFCLAAITGLAAPQILGAMVNFAQNGMETTRIDILAIAFLAVLCVGGFFKWLAELRARTFSERALANTREKLVSHALDLPLDTIEDASTGDLLSRVIDDIDNIDWVFREGIQGILFGVIGVLFTCMAMIVTSPLLALGLLVVIPFLVITMMWYLRRNATAMRACAECTSILHSNLHETAVGARTVEALGLARKRIHVRHQLLKQYVASQYFQRQLTIKSAAWLTFSYALPVAAVLLIGGLAYLENWVELGTVTTMVLYAQGLVYAINELLTWLEWAFTIDISLRRILGVRSQLTEIKETVTPQGQDITICNARFGYTADLEVLHGINLHIPQGQRLAIVGPSGAGKSTLARLLAGIAAPTSGSVKIGDLEVSSMNREVLRSEILLLTQEHHTFSGTVRENLTLPAGQWSDDQLIAALTSVGAQAWLMQLPKGLATQIGSDGLSVSSVVAQKIALARVILANPHTVVLDEATSLLDVSSARDLERSLNTVLAGRTVIAIAHRLHTSAAADRVVVMEHGRIVEDGAPDTLRNADGPYARLVRAAMVGA